MCEYPGCKQKSFPSMVVAMATNHKCIKLVKILTLNFQYFEEFVDSCKMKFKTLNFLNICLSHITEYMSNKNMSSYLAET